MNSCPSPVESGDHGRCCSADVQQAVGTARDACLASQEVPNRRSVAATRNGALPAQWEFFRNGEKSVNEQNADGTLGERPVVGSRGAHIAGEAASASAGLLSETAAFAALTPARLDRIDETACRVYLMLDRVSGTFDGTVLQMNPSQPVQSSMQAAGVGACPSRCCDKAAFFPS